MLSADCADFFLATKRHKRAQKNIAPEGTEDAENWLAWCSWQILLVLTVFVCYYGTNVEMSVFLTIEPR